VWYIKKVNGKLICSYIDDDKSVFRRKMKYFVSDNERKTLYIMNFKKEVLTAIHFGRVILFL